ncbi:hypothetical protein PROFUN_09556 [Planoprotostelium fungivorum]|uniref:Uncharacterized protein n=1 Tax=Planoprotostelium fungivorum TaxID=1890364 RepID=A0A2P6MT34_9EUKA|nr:hypothetical protein PROFUN_09556 [Planoprotostelium fungivorum]
MAPTTLNVEAASESCGSKYKPEPFNNEMLFQLLLFTLAVVTAQQPQPSLIIYTYNFLSDGMANAIAYPIGVCLPQPGGTTSIKVTPGGRYIVDGFSSVDCSGPPSSTRYVQMNIANSNNDHAAPYYATVSAVPDDAYHLKPSDTVTEQYSTNSSCTNSTFVGAKIVYNTNCNSTASHDCQAAPGNPSTRIFCGQRTYVLPSPLPPIASTNYRNATGVTFISADPVGHPGGTSSLTASITLLLVLLLITH